MCVILFHGVQPKICKKWSLGEAAYCQKLLKSVLKKSINCSIGRICRAELPGYI